MKLKMSVTLSCAGWWCGGGGGWRGLTGLTVGKHGYRWRLAAAAEHREHILSSAPTVAWVARRRQEHRKWWLSPAPAPQYYHNPTTKTL